MISRYFIPEPKFLRILTDRWRRETANTKPKAKPHLLPLIKDQVTAENQEGFRNAQEGQESRFLSYLCLLCPLLPLGYTGQAECIFHTDITFSKDARRWGQRAFSGDISIH